MNDFEVKDRSTILASFTDGELQKELNRRNQERNLRHRAEKQARDLENLKRKGGIEVFSRGQTWTITSHCVKRYLERSKKLKMVSQAIGKIRHHLDSAREILKNSTAFHEVEEIRAVTYLYDTGWLFVVRNRVLLTTYPYRPSLAARRSQTGTDSRPETRFKIRGNFKFLKHSHAGEQAVPSRKHCGALHFPGCDEGIDLWSSRLELNFDHEGADD